MDRKFKGEFKDSVLKKDSEEKSKMARKVLDALVFEKLGIEYEIRTYSGLRHNHNQQVFLFNIFINVDVDRMLEFSPTYDSKYENLMHNIEESVDSALRYVNLKNNYDGVDFKYVNDTLAENEIDRLQSELISQIQFNFPEVTESQIEDSAIWFHLYKSEHDHPFLRVDFAGTDIRSYTNVSKVPNRFNIHKDTIVTCDVLNKMMSDLFNRSPLSMNLDSENFLCQ
tara:strand:- start:161 stop:838 length:678 start_codon:yes stop_codon:yes gene_type:complete